MKTKRKEYTATGNNQKPKDGSKKPVPVWLVEGYLDSEVYNSFLHWQEKYLGFMMLEDNIDNFPSRISESAQFVNRPRHDLSSSSSSSKPHL